MAFFRSRKSAAPFSRIPTPTPRRVSIKDALREGQELIVQVDKDERGNKGAALTTFISLAGRYLVLMPNNPRGGGVSRRVEGEDRNELRDTISQLDVAPGMSIIARTAGIGRSVEELTWDLNYLMQLWRAIETAAKQQGGAFLIYQEGSLVIRAIRDYFHQEIGEILIDTESIYDQARQFMGHVMPQNVSRVKMYKDDVPLFSRFQIEHQIETAYSRQVPLPSGGAVVIDHTEALVSVDVNSARATRGADIEETALRTNLEAADEIARQLRLRDLGGLVVIDFIDMESARNQRDVENRLRDALKYDRARVQTGKISRFGLLELSRQRLQTSLGETSHIACPRCHGTGHIRSVESSALHILRILQEEAMKENTAALHAQVPVDVATYLLNEKRNEFHSIETRLKVNVLLVPNVNLQTPNYSVSRMRHDELNLSEVVQPSYKMADMATEVAEPAANVQKPEPQRPQAAVQGITPAQPAPTRREEPGPSIMEKIFGWLTRKPEAKPEPPKVRPRDPQQRRDHMRDGRGRGRGRPDEKRGERAPRQDGESAREQNRPRGQERAERRPQERPHQQQQRPPRPEHGLATVEQRPPGDRPEGARDTEGRGRRRRGRHERQTERSENVNPQLPRGDQPANTAAAPEMAKPHRERKRPAPATPSPEAQTAILEPVMFTHDPVAAEPPPTIAVETLPQERYRPEPPPTIAAETMPQERYVPEPPRTNATETLPQERYLPEVNTDERQPEPVAAAPARQPWKMEPIALPPDMVMIETQSDKAARMLEEERQDEPRPARPARQRNSETVIPDEPLQQVETRKE